MTTCLLLSRDIDIGLTGLLCMPVLLKVAILQVIRNIHGMTSHCAVRHARTACLDQGQGNLRKAVMNLRFVV